MDKIKRAIDQNKQLRDRKDALKKSLKSNTKRVIEFEGIIVPKIVHTPSVVDRAMQWYFNGFVMSFSDGVLIVDPGVDFYSRFTTTGLNVKDIRGVFVSHEHLDHCGDLLVFLDMIAKTNTPIDLILPVNVIEGVLPEYYRKLIEEHDAINVIIMRDDSKNIVHANWKTLSSFEVIQLHHSTQHTFGFRVKHNNKTIAYISDTGYAKSLQTPQGKVSARESDGSFDSIAEKYDSIKIFIKEADVLICNINDLFYNRHSLTHLSGWDVADMVEGSAVRHLLLLHLSPYDADGNNSNGMYIDFFAHNRVKCTIPNGDELRMMLYGI